MNPYDITQFKYDPTTMGMSVAPKDTVQPVAPVNPNVVSPLQKTNPPLEGS